MKPLRAIKPNPKDPTWTFQFASRERMQKIIAYFQSFPRPQGWKRVKNKPILTWKQRNETEEFWPTVPEKHREKVNEWFWRKIAEIKKERGIVSPAKYRSLKGNAVNFGRYVLTQKRSMNRAHYEIKKAIYLAWQEFERKEKIQSMPKTKSKFLAVA